MRYYKILMPALLAAFVAACGGGGGDDGTTTEVPVSVTISGKVYDQELSGAEVEVLVGNTVVATTTTDSNGVYSVPLSVTQAAREQRCVVRARRGSFSLRSLLGNVGSLADAATSNGGRLNGDNLPAANVTNVSTAVAAVIEAGNSNALPSSQADIDAAIDVIQADTALQDKVTKIAAIIKAVVDYGANTDASNTITATDTDALAKALASAASQDFIDSLAAIVVSATTTVTETQLIAEVENDPVLAAQLPSDEVSLAAEFVASSNSYFLLDPYSAEVDDGSVFKLDGAGGGTIWSTADMGTGGDAAMTNVSATDDTVSLTIAGTDFLTVKILGGNINSLFVHVSSNGVDEGTRNLRRIIPVSTAVDGVNNINLASHIIDGIFVDFYGSKVLGIGSACDGSSAVSSGISTLGSFPNPALSGSSLTCSVHASGMVKITSSHPDLAPTTFTGLLADSWNWDGATGAINLAMNTATITDTSTTSAASYDRSYLPQDSISTSGLANNPIALRVENDGGTSLRIAYSGTGTTVDPVLADIYKRASDGSVSVLNKKIVLGQTSGWFNKTVNYSTKAIDNTGLRYMMNIGKHSGGLLSAIFSTTDDTNTTATSLSNPLDNVNTRLTYQMSALTAADIFNNTTDLTASFNQQHLTLSLNITVAFNRANGSDTSGTGAVTTPDGTINTFTWSENQAPTPASGLSGTYPNTVKVAFDDWADEIYTYIDKTTGVSSFIAGSYVIDTANGNAIVDADGWLLTRN